MAQLMLVNPRGRKAGTSTRTRKTTTRKRSTAPRRRRRTSIRTHARRAYSRVNKRVASWGRRKANKGMSGVFDTLAHGAIGAAGGIALDVAMAKLPLPSMLKTGVGHTATKLAGAVGVGILGQKFLSKEMAQALAIGSVATVLHDAMRDVLSPHISMADVGYYSPGYPVGQSNADVALEGMGDIGDMGMYLNEMGEYVQ